MLEANGGHADVNELVELSPAQLNVIRSDVQWLVDFSAERIELINSILRELGLHDRMTINSKLGLIKAATYLANEGLNLIVDCQMRLSDTLKIRPDKLFKVIT